MLHDLIKQATKNLAPDVEETKDWFSFDTTVDCSDSEFIELEEGDEYEECECEEYDEDEDCDEDDY